LVATDSLVPLLIVDTGVLVAAADRSDPHHEPATALLDSTDQQLVTTAMVIAEAAHLIDRELGPKVEALLYQSIVDGGLRIEALTTDDWQRVGELVLTYADLRLGGTDAGLIAVAERRGQYCLATLDRRHFSVVRPRHVDAFMLLP
jgi:predicted nucleic acid-binding protein